MTRSTAHTVDDVMLIAKTLIMIAPSADFAAGIAALANAQNAADLEMVELIRQRWQYWVETLEQHQLALAQDQV